MVNLWVCRPLARMLKKPNPVFVYLALMAFVAICVGMLYIDARVYSYLSYLLILAVLGIGYMIFADKKLTVVEKKKISVIFIVAFFVVFFWSAFEQAGASLTFFAEEQTKRDLGFFTVPASWFQSLNSIFVVVFAPLFAWLWIKLGRKEPSAPTKMAIGLMLLAVGYFVIAIGVKDIGTGVKVSMIWLIGMYAFHTWGELCLSPIGLSLVNKLSPVKFASLLMAVWFLANAGSNVLAGKLSSLYPDGTKVTNFAGYEMHNINEFFMLFVFMAGIASIILFFLTKWLQKTMNATT
jgi:proton-dependent oligopeptide transporter, POT family